jgi:hypothetical protein
MSISVSQLNWVERLIFVGLLGTRIVPNRCVGMTVVAIEYLRTGPCRATLSG